MGNWMNIGPRHPMGLTPWARYSCIVSWDRRDRSSLYRAWSFWSSGCRPPIFLIMRLCFTVRGNMMARMMMVKAMMLSPKLLDSTLYNSTRLLIMGRMNTAPQTSPSIPSISNCFVLQRPLSAYGFLGPVHAHEITCLPGSSSTEKRQPSSGLPRPETSRERIERSWARK